MRKMVKKKTLKKTKELSKIKSATMESDTSNLSKQGDVVLTWPEKLASIDINKIHPKRKCIVFMMAESSPAYTAHIEMFEIGSEQEYAQELKSINYEKLCKLCKQFIEDPTIEFSVKEDFVQACQEAVAYIKDRKSLEDLRWRMPRELMAKLLKFAIIYIIEKDILEEELTVLVEQKKMRDIADLLKEGNDKNENLKKAKDKRGNKKKKGKDKKSKDSKTSAKKGKKGEKKKHKKSKSKGNKAESDEDVCKNITGKDDVLEKEGLGQQTIDIQDKLLYIGIVGFFDLKLVIELISIGIPIESVVEVSGKEENVVNPIKIRYPTSLVDLNVDLVAAYYANRIASELVPRDILVESSISEIVSFDLQKPKPDLIYNFWLKAHEILGSDTFTLLEDTYHSKYTPPNFMRVTQDSEIYMDICEKLYVNFLGFLKAMMDIRRRHSEYLGHLKSVKLGHTPHHRKASTLKTYSKILDSIPPDCHNIGLTMVALIAEVEKKLIVIESGDFSNKLSDIQRESKDIDEKPKKRRTYPLPDTGQWEFHSCVRDQVTNMFRKHQQRLKPVRNIGNNSQKWSHMYYAPTINYSIDQKPFVLHEANFLEMAINPYLQIADILFDTSIDIMSKLLPAFLWSNQKKQTDLEKLIYRHQIYVWQKQFNLHEDDLIDGIKIYLMAHVVCRSQVDSKPPNYNFIDMFPPRNEPVEPILLSSTGRPTSILRINPYEDINLRNYKWKEVLAPCVFLQEAHKARHQFECMDYYYAKNIDAFLLHFHNDVDVFGIHKKIKVHPLRTPVCIRDFCKYILHEDAKWVQNEKQWHLYDIMHKEDLKHRQDCLEFHYVWDKPETGIYTLNRLKYVMPDSLEDEYKKAALETKEIAEEPKVKDKKAKKSKKTKGGKKKEKSKQSEISSDDNTSKSCNTNKPNSPSVQLQEGTETIGELPPRLAEEAEAMRERILRPEDLEYFISYDLGNRRCQYRCSQTTFHSLDGMTVRVDHSNWLGIYQNPKFYLDIRANLHHLVLYPDVDCQFMFHFYMSNDVAIAFAKPNNFTKPEPGVVENKFRTSLHQHSHKQSHSFSASKDPKPFCHILEKCKVNIKCLQIPYVEKKREYVLPYKEWEDFINLQQKSSNMLIYQAHNMDDIFADVLRNAITEQELSMKPETPPATLRYVLDEFEESFGGKYGQGKFDEQVDEKLTLDDNLGRTSSINQSQTIQSDDTVRDGASIKEISAKEEIRLNNEFTKALKKAVKNKTPIFKICSTKVHRNDYVLRVKDHVEVKVGDVVTRVCFKPSFKARKIFEVKKIYPVNFQDEENSPNPYDLRISLPSGLHVRSEPGIGSNLYHIKQLYTVKGPQCKDIEQEEWRAILRNGTVLIKKLDGTVTAYTINGSIIKFDIPFFKGSSAIKSKFKVSEKNNAYENNLRLKRIFKQTIRRRIRHLVRGPESLYHRSRREHLKYQKKKMLPNQIYLSEDTTSYYPKYTVYTTNGKVLKIVRGKVAEEKCIFISKESDVLLGEQYYEREDGTCSMCYSDGSNVVQFPDGTRIKSWFALESQTESIESSDDEDEGCEVEESLHGLQEKWDAGEEKTVAEKIQDLYKKLKHLDPEKHERKIRKIIFNVIDGLSLTDLGESTSSEETQEGNASENTLGNIPTEEKPTEISELFFRGVRKSLKEWTIVNMFYAVEHPNYASVLYDTVHQQVKIVLPGDMVVDCKSRDEFCIDLDNTVSAYVSPVEVRFQHSACPICNQKTTATLFVKHLYDSNPTVPLGEKLLECKDTFGKVFTVDYEGNCSRNNDYTQDNQTHTCKNHRTVDTHKLFAMHRDFSATAFWNENMYLTRMGQAQTNFDDVLERRKDENNPKTVEIRSVKREHYCNRFLMPFLHPRISLTMYHPKNTSNEKKLAYITRRFLNPLIDVKTIEPIFDFLANVKTMERHRSILGITEQATVVWNFEDTNTIDSEEEYQYVDCPNVCEPFLNINEEHKAARTLYDRWRQWKTHTEILKGQVRSGYIPKYPYPDLRKREEPEPTPVVEVPVVTYEDKATNTSSGIADEIGSETSFKITDLFGSVGKDEMVRDPNATSDWVKCLAERKKMLRAQEQVNEEFELHGNTQEAVDESEFAMSMAYINYKQPYGSRTCLFAPETLNIPGDDMKKVGESVDNIEFSPSSVFPEFGGIEMEISSEMLDIKRHLNRTGTDVEESLSSTGSWDHKIPASMQVLRSQDYFPWMSVEKNNVYNLDMRPNKSRSVLEKQLKPQQYKPVYKRLGGTYPFPEEISAEEEETNEDQLLAEAITDTLLDYKSSSSGLSDITWKSSATDIETEPARKSSMLVVRGSECRIPKRETMYKHSAGSIGVFDMDEDIDTSSTRSPSLRAFASAMSLDMDVETIKLGNVGCQTLTNPDTEVQTEATQHQNELKEYKSERNRYN